MRLSLRMKARRLPAMALGAALALSGVPAVAQQQAVQSPVATFTGLDKITGRITTFDVWIDETVQFGALQVTPRTCREQVAGDDGRVISFVEVDEITLQAEIQRIFSGWMFAESPGLNAIEHPVYDVWLVACKTDTDVPAPGQ